MNEKKLEEFKKKAIAEMPLRDAEKEHIANGNYLHQIHFDKVPDDEKEKMEWLKRELKNYFTLRCIGNKLWKEFGDPIEGHEHPFFSDKEFEDMLLLFQLPNILVNQEYNLLKGNEVEMKESGEKIEFEGIIEGIEETQQAVDNPQKLTIIDEINGNRQVHLFDDGKLLKHREKIKVILKVAKE